MSKKPANYYQNTRTEMMDFVPEGIKTSLEAGCSEGSFSRQLIDKYKTETWGIEPHKPSAKKASKYLHKVFDTSVEEAIKKLPSNHFDLIVFNDVLEHLYDPEQVLKDLKRTLTKKGVVVASIPNIRYFHNFRALALHSDWVYEEAGVLDFTHLRFFTHKSIKMMFEEAGYKVDEMQGINPTPHIPFKFKVFNFATRNRFWDCPYIQFGVRASVDGLKSR